MYGPSRAADIQYTANRRKRQALFGPPRGEGLLQLPLNQQISDFQQVLTFAVVQLHDLLGRLHHVRHHHGHAHPPHGPHAHH